MELVLFSRTMGPHHPKSKQAWKELNEHFGRCPKCGIDPFEGWGALSSHTAHMKALYSIVHSLANADIVRLSSTVSDIANSGKALSEVRHSESGVLQGLSELLTDSHSDASNVLIKEGKFECKECGAIWDPEQWDTSFSDLGFTVIKY